MQGNLIEGNVYKIWRDGIYLGTATWMNDKNIGLAFTKIIVDENGKAITEVYNADRWELSPTADEGSR